MRSCIIFNFTPARTVGGCNGCMHAQVCTKVEEWDGTRVEEYKWEGKRLKKNLCDTEFYKKTTWFHKGEVFDEALEELTPDNRGNNQDTVRVTFAGEHHAWHRVAAFMFANRELPSGRYLTWREFNKERGDGGHAYEVNHTDKQHFNNTVANLEILPAVVHMKKDGRR